jgi:uncharacterized protein YndB with AHSA1/START domain
MTRNARTEFRIDRATHTIHFERTLPGSRERAFDAWTQPEQIRTWWDPSGRPLASCEIDLRPGGRFKFVNQGDAHSPPFEGVYRMVERPAQLVFEALGSLGTVLLSQRGDDTTMQVSIRCSSAEHLEQFVKLGVDEGTRQTLDNLAAQLGAQ